MASGTTASVPGLHGGGDCARTGFWDLRRRRKRKSPKVPRRANATPPPVPSAITFVLDLLWAGADAWELDAVGVLELVERDPEPGVEVEATRGRVWGVLFGAMGGAIASVEEVVVEMEVEVVPGVDVELCDTDAGITVVEAVVEVSIFALAEDVWAELIALVLAADVSTLILKSFDSASVNPVLSCIDRNNVAPLVKSKVVAPFQVQEPPEQFSGCILSNYKDKENMDDLRLRTSAKSVASWVMTRATDDALVVHVNICVWPRVNTGNGVAVVSELSSGKTNLSALASDTKMMRIDARIFNAMLAMA